MLRRRQLKFTGISQLFVQMTKNLTVRDKLFVQSAAGVMIFIMMLLVLRSLEARRLSAMVPNLLPIIITLGLMGIMKIPLDCDVDCLYRYRYRRGRYNSSLIRYKRSFQKSRHYGLALETSLTTSGRANAFTTLILCAGS